MRGGPPAAATAAAAAAATAAAERASGSALPMPGPGGRGTGPGAARAGRQAGKPSPAMAYQLPRAPAEPWISVLGAGPRWAAQAPQLRLRRLAQAAKSLALPVRASEGLSARPQCPKR